MSFPSLWVLGLAQAMFISTTPSRPEGDAAQAFKNTLADRELLLN